MNTVLPRLRARLRLFLGVLACLAGVTPAAGHPDPVAAFKADSAYCEQPMLHQETTVFFPRLYRRARDIKTDFCSSDPPPVNARVTSVITLFIEARQEFLRIEAFSEPALDQYADLSRHLANSHKAGHPPAALNRVAGGAGIAIDLLELRPGRQTECDRQVASRWPGHNCQDYTEQFRHLYNHTQRVVSGPGAAGATAWLAQLERQWDRYFRQSRSQTSLELAVNGWLFKRANTARQFLPPPDRQLVLLHPDLALEHLPGAVDGAQTEEALLVEVLGISSWRPRPWYLPAGAALATVYADRPDASDWAPALVVHLRSRLSIGYSYHHGEGGLLVSLDLGKLLQEKGDTIRTLRGRTFGN